jgi:transposase
MTRLGRLLRSHLRLAVGNAIDRAIPVVGNQQRTILHLQHKGGMTTKILALTDALVVRFVLMPGHRFDTVGVAPLIDGLAFDGFIADKAFDSNSIIADLNERGAKIVISQHPRRASPLPIDAEIYKWRHLIENFFCKLKEFKRIAMRADKTDQSFAANIHLAAAVINSR